MDTYFKNWDEISVNGATVPFYKKNNFIGFDSSSCTPPGPMVNAVAGLNLLKDKNTKLIMINHKFPVGLIAKIEQIYKYEKEDLQNGFVKLTFTINENSKNHTLDINPVCKG